MNSLQLLKEQFKTLHQASRETTTVTWTTRAHRLDKLNRMLREHQEAICKAINQDFGHRSTDETLLCEFFPTLSGIKHARKHGKKWMAQRKIATDWWFWPAKNTIQPQPLGLVGIIAPWNYPLFSTMGPVIAALVSGNRVMVKTSEYAPAFSQWLAETVPLYFNADELVIIEGDSSIASEFSALPFDHLLFTGSTAVGKMVMKAASQNLTPVTLELGGKSPAIVLEDANLEHAVSRILSGKLINAGQTCIAPDYVYLPENHIDQFIELAKKWVKKHYPNMATNPDYTHIINARRKKHLQNIIDEAKSKGANFIPLSDSINHNHNTLLLPFLVTQLPNDTLLMQEEIFGPILPLLTYSNINKALMDIRANPRPLALYVFGKNQQDIQNVLNNTVSGGVSVNDTLYHVAQEKLPFGGVGASGMGAYHGKTGFETFSHLKPIFKQSKINGMSLLLPPYGRLFKALLRFLMR